MKSLSLYELSQEFASLEAALLESMDDETGEIDESFIEQLNESEIAFKEKAVNVAKYIKNLQANSEGIKLAIQKQQKRKRSMDNMIHRLKQYLIESMDKVGVDSIDGEVPLKTKINPPKLIIDNEYEIEDDYFEWQRVLNKSKYKDALNQGVESKGGHLEQGRSIKIG